MLVQKVKPHVDCRPAQNKQTTTTTTTTQLVIFFPLSERARRTVQRARSSTQNLLPTPTMLAMPKPSPSNDSTVKKQICCVQETNLRCRDSEPISPLILCPAELNSATLPSLFDKQLTCQGRTIQASNVFQFGFTCSPINTFDQRWLKATRQQPRTIS